MQPPMLRTAVLASVLAGCAYQPGSFTSGPGPTAVFAGQRATIDCLDVAVARRPDHDGSAVLQYRFGNRCNRPVTVDLARVAVVARFADGAEEALAPYDPDQEIRPAQLAGRGSGGEALAYSTARRAAQVCADLSSIVPPAAGAAAASGRWLCFGSAIDVGAVGAADAAPPAGAPAEPADSADSAADPDPPADPAPAAPSPSEVTP
jgi:hypothetical protein